MALEFLEQALGEELYQQVCEKLDGVTGITLANIADGSYIPKAKFDEERAKTRKATHDVNELAAKLNEANTKIDDVTAQLSEANARVANVNSLNAQIAKLSKDVTDRDNRLSTLSMDYDIKDALRAAKVRDVDIVFSLLDRDKISAGKDGKLEGVEDQLKAIKERRAFLFEEEDKAAKRGGFSGQQDIISGQNSDNANSVVNDAIRAMAGR